MSLLRLALAAALFPGSALLAAETVDWPHWRGPERDGKTSESLGEVEALREVWSAEVGIGFSSFSVVAGRLYTMGNEEETDTVWCLDAATGKVLWRHDYPCEPEWNAGESRGTPPEASSLPGTCSSPATKARS